MHSQVDCQVQFGCILIRPENENPKNDKEFKVKINADNFSEIFSSTLKPSEVIPVNKLFSFNKEPFDLNITLKEKSRNFLKNIFQAKSDYEFKIQVKAPNQLNKTKYSLKGFEFLDKQQVIKYLMQIDFSATSRLKIFKENRFYISRIKKTKKYDYLSLMNLLDEQIVSAMKTFGTLVFGSKYLIAIDNRSSSFEIILLITKKPVFMGLTVNYKSNTIALAKLIDNRELPIIQYSNCLSLDTKTQAAMLVRNSLGDYAIIRAQKNDTILKIDWYSFLTKSNKSFEINDSYNFRITNPERSILAEVDLKQDLI
jgi:hypothetical protein